MAGQGAHSHDAVSQEDVDRALAVGEQLQAQLSIVDEQRAYLQGLRTDLLRARDALDAMRRASEGDEILVPLGGGTFVHARLSRPGVVLRSIGSGLQAESGLDAAISALEERAENAEKAAERLGEEAEHLTAELGEISGVLRAGARPPSR